MRLESLGAVRERERERERESYTLVKISIALFNNLTHTSRFNEIKKANKITKGVLCLNVDRHK